MRAIEVSAHGDPSVLTSTERPAPEPGPGEVVVDVAAAGVNFADVAKRRGTYPDGPDPPYVPGIEVSGTVVERGDAVDGRRSGTGGTDGDGAVATVGNAVGGPLEIGDRVTAYVDAGGYAERATAPVERTIRLPDGVGVREAAALPVQWLTAHNALFEWGGLADGERVLVHAGAGGVGSAAVQLAAERAGAVLATASTPEKRAFAEDCGADEAIPYDGVPAAVRDRTDGIDLVLDGVGGEAFEAGLDALAPGGRVVAYGLASGDVARVSTPRLLFGNHAVIGYHLGEAVDRDPDRAFAAADPVLGRVAEGSVAVRIDRTLPLADAARAHARLEDRRTRGKVLLEP